MPCDPSIFNPSCPFCLHRKAQEQQKKVVVAGCVPQAQPRMDYLKGLSIIGVCEHVFAYFGFLLRTRCCNVGMCICISSWVLLVLCQSGPHTQRYRCSDLSFTWPPVIWGSSILASLLLGGSIIPPWVTNLGC